MTDPRTSRRREVVNRSTTLRWGRVPFEAATASLSPTALRIMIAMACHADGASRLAWPSQETLARELGWESKSARRRVRAALAELEAADLIERAGQRVIGPRGRWVRQYLVAPFPADGVATVPSALDEALADGTKSPSPMALNRAADGVATTPGTYHLEQTIPEQKKLATEEAKTGTPPPWAGTGQTWHQWQSAVARQILERAAAEAAEQELEKGADLAPLPPAVEVKS